MIAAWWGDCQTYREGRGCGHPVNCVKGRVGSVVFLAKQDGGENQTPEK